MFIIDICVSVCNILWLKLWHIHRITNLIHLLYTLCFRYNCTNFLFAIYSNEWFYYLSLFNPFLDFGIFMLIIHFIYPFTVPKYTFEKWLNHKELTSKYLHGSDQSTNYGSDICNGRQTVAYVCSINNFYLWPIIKKKAHIPQNTFIL